MKWRRQTPILNPNFWRTPKATARITVWSQFARVHANASAGLVQWSAVPVSSGVGSGRLPVNAGPVGIVPPLARLRRQAAKRLPRWSDASHDIAFGVGSWC